MKLRTILYCSFLWTSFTFAQKYEFSTKIDLETTEIKSQDNTGTCWSYSTSSFLESEIIRLTGKRIDLSEMYTVRNTYSLKAWNYVMRRGKAQFSEGGLAHDVINASKIYGLVPEQAFTGLENDAKEHDHTEMVSVIKGMLDVYIDKPGKRLSKKWKTSIEGILDIYLGKVSSSFNFEGVQYTPKSFLKMTKIRPENYLTITSFSHRPFYTSFVLNIPDNFSNGSFYNVPLDEMIEVVDNALTNGFTVELDCDVSERTFSSKYGIAFIPESKEDNTKGLTEIVKEKDIDQVYRQEEFEAYTTTDDHLMHITGLLIDQNGTKYYKVKNSWGTENQGNDGYVYISEAFLKLKTISILVHKDALPKTTKKKLSF